MEYWPLLLSGNGPMLLGAVMRVMRGGGYRLVRIAAPHCIRDVPDPLVIILAVALMAASTPLSAWAVQSQAGVLVTLTPLILWAASATKDLITSIRAARKRAETHAKKSM